MAVVVVVLDFQQCIFLYNSRLSMHYSKWTLINGILVNGKKDVVRVAYVRSLLQGFELYNGLLDPLGGMFQMIRGCLQRCYRGLQAYGAICQTLRRSVQNSYGVLQ